MRIGIDIDNTLVDTRKSVFYYKYKSKYKNKKGYYYNWDKKDQDDFLKEYIEKIQMHVKVKEHAKESIDELKKMHHEIIFITYRDNILTNTTKKNTIEYLKKHNIYYDEIIFGALDKGKICEENHIDLLIDDSNENIESAVKHNIPVLVFPMFYNKNTKEKRVKNWKEIVSYIKTM